MSVEWKVFGGAAAFAGVLGGLYWLAAHEHAGAIMLAFSGAALLMVAVYLVVVGRRAGARPSDRGDADPGDEADFYGAGAGAGEYYPSASVWPFVSAAGALLLGFGMVFGLGVASMGIVLLLGAIGGYAAEANAKP